MLCGGRVLVEHAPNGACVLSRALAPPSPNFWDLAGLVSDPVHSSTGLPEGDCWSVTAMIGIAWTWANELRHVIAPIVPAIRLSVSAYADNWSWQSNDHQIHVELFRATHRVALCLGLEIDHSKTWQWATSQQGVSLMSIALQANPWPVRLQSVMKAKDLGTPMVYQGRAGTSMLPDRESEAVQRLQRIEWSCRSLHDKVHQIRASVYPVAFHGTEVGVIATHQLDNLRNQIVQAVFHKIPSMNSAIAFQLIDEHLLDPALFAILLSIKMAQRFLHNSPPEERQNFLTIAATAKGNTGHIWGPATALKANLLRIGWGVSRDGMITSPHLIPLSLLHDSFAKLQRFAKASWEVDFFLHYTQRKNLRGYPDISHRLTTRALKKFPGATHVRLVRELAGGFQTKEQQSKWDTQVSGQCELCQFEDSRYHRIFECPDTQSVRARFKSVCNFDQLVEAEWHETAGIMIPRLQGLAQALIHNLPEPEVPIFVRQHVVHSGTRVAFYTDGSCQCPEQMPFSTAASALIMDLCQSDSERIWQANNWLSTRTMPQSLVRIWTAQCPGEQSIHRAELHALVKACEQLSHVDVFSDCQNAIDAVHKAQLGTLRVHPDEDHLDLLRRLQQAPGLHQVRVCKIKAHLSPELVADPLLRYHTLGTQLANDWAQRRSLDQHDPVNAELLMQMREVRQQRSDLDAFLQYVAALQLERQTQLDLQKLTSDEPISASAFQCLVSWTVSLPRPPFDLAFEAWEGCCWGRDIACRVWRWISQLVWPAHIAPDDNDGVGVTWLELFVSFCLDQQVLIGVLRQAKQEKELLLLTSWHDVIQYQVQVETFCQSFATLVQQVAQLSNPHGWPTVPKGMVKSLYMLGARQWRHGLRVRPVFPAQTETICLVRSWITTGHATSHLKWVPSRFFDPIPTHAAPLPWSQLIKSFRARLRRFRAESPQ